MLARHFGAESSTAVQHQVRTAVSELLNESRERLYKQFSSADESNPLASFQKLAVQAIRQSSDQQHAHLREMNRRIGSLQLEIAKLQAEREKALEVAAEHERSTAKGRPYEEAVFEAVDAIAGGAGDDCDAVGDLPGVGGRKGDVVVAIDGCSGTAARADRLRGQELARGQEGRAGRARRGDGPPRCVVCDLGRALRGAAAGARPAAARDQRRQALRGLRPRAGPPGLQLAYLLARARVLMARGEADGLDTTAVRSELERAQGALEEGAGSASSSRSPPTASPPPARSWTRWRRA